MMNVILLLLVIGIGFVNAQTPEIDAVRNAALELVNDFRLDYTDITEQITDTCSAANRTMLLSSVTCGTLNIDLAKIRAFDPAEYEKFGRVFCVAACGDPIVTYLRRCLSSSGENFANFFSLLCAKTSSNTPCYTATLLTSIKTSFTACDPDPTTDACCTSAKASVAAAECCVNLLNVGGLISTTSQLPSSCTTIPQNCAQSSLAAPTSATTAKAGAVIHTFGILVGILAVFITFMLQSLF